MATIDNSAMAGMDHSGMDHSAMSGMDHGAMGADGQMAGMDHGGHAMGSMKMRDFSNAPQVKRDPSVQTIRSEEHTSELQSLMRISYAVFCLKKKKSTKQTATDSRHTIPKHKDKN